MDMKPNSSENDEQGPPNVNETLLSGQPTGWAAMAERMRAYDEDRIKDVKEDIDGLFIFVRLLHSVSLRVSLIRMSHSQVYSLRC